MPLKKNSTPKFEYMQLPTRFKVHFGVFLILAKIRSVIDITIKNGQDSVAAMSLMARLQSGQTN